MENFVLNPLPSMKFSAPPRLTLPETANWSYSVPAVVAPSTSISSVPVLPNAKSPATVSRPAVPAPPGRSTALFVSVPEPTFTVPLPMMVPVLVNPPTLAKVLLSAISSVPDWVKVLLSATDSVPADTWSTPVLFKVLGLTVSVLPAVAICSVPALVRVVPPRVKLSLALRVAPEVMFTLAMPMVPVPRL